MCLKKKPNLNSITNQWVLFSCYINLEMFSVERRTTDYFGYSIQKKNTRITQRQI